jgi:formate dehydrogenase major subunit
MKLRHSIAERVAGFVRDWSLPRQFAGEDPIREAAQSTMSRQLRPRLEEADWTGSRSRLYGAKSKSKHW